jgi:hypothetical protein
MEIEWAGHHSSEKLHRGVVREACDLQRTKSGECRESIARSTKPEDKSDTFRSQPASRESCGLQGFGIHQLRVVDDAQETLGCGGIGQQGERGQSD